MSALVFDQTKLLSGKIGAKCDSCYAQARKRALEAVEAGEGACVSPVVTAYISIGPRRVMGWKAYSRAHGSFLVPLAEAAANFLGSKPVMEGRAIVMELGSLANVVERARHVNCECRAMLHTVKAAQAEQLYKGEGDDVVVMGERRIARPPVACSRMSWHSRGAFPKIR
jgi:hypothetical protein